MRATKSGIARDCERELKAAIQVTVGSLTRFYWACEKGGQWQSCTNGLFLLPGIYRSFCTEVGVPGRTVEVGVYSKSFS